MNTAISNLLRAGVLLSIGVVILGLVSPSSIIRSTSRRRRTSHQLTNPAALYPHTSATWWRRRARSAGRLS